MGPGDDDDFDEDTDVVVPERLESDLTSERRGCLIVLAGPKTGEMFVLDRRQTMIGRSEKMDIKLADASISRRHAQIDRDGDRYRLVDLGSKNGSFINGTRVDDSAELADGDKLQIGRNTVVRFSVQDELDERFQKQLLDSAMRDAMTGAYNRRFFLGRLDAEFKFAERHDQPLSLLLFDIDHFKEINDTRGHLVGDQALIQFAKCISDAIRTEDVFARYGGEEFAVIARAIGTEEATTFADRLRESVAAMTLEDDGETFSITVSIGIASIPDHPIRDAVDMLAIADRALYIAKRRGRNQVSVCTVAPPNANPDDTTLA